jgi:hypothetical protein
MRVIVAAPGFPEDDCIVLTACPRKGEKIIWKNLQGTVDEVMHLAYGESDDCDVIVTLSQLVEIP